MRRRKSTCLFLLVVPVILLVFVFYAKVKAASYLNICTQERSQYYPASAWNSSQSEYLSVWFSDQDPNRGIYGVRLDSEGNFKGGTSPCKIASIKGGQIYSPSVACNSKKNQYLVTWYDQSAGSSSATSIYAAIVSFDNAGTTGKPKITPITGIHTAKQNPSSPKVAWDGDQYLIVWYDYSGDLTAGASANADIYGVRIDSNGTVLDPDSLEICTADSAQTDPVITGYQRSGDSGSSGGSEEKGWLVAWVDGRNPSTGKDIYATLIKQNADASAPIEASFPLCNSEKDQKSVNVTTGPDGFFAVWLDGRFKDTPDGRGGSLGNFLIGSCVSFDGQRVPNPRFGADIPIAGVNPNIRVSGDPAGVACIQNNYMVVWDNGSMVYGARISLQGDILDIQSGVPAASTLSDTHKDSTFPSLASSGSGKNALITWMQISTDGTDISGIIYTLPQSPHLDWASGASTGVTPNHGEGGTNFTFKVNYTKAAGGGGDPVLSVFLLDLDRDGRIESNEVFSMDKANSSSNSNSTIYQKTIPVLYNGTNPDDPNNCVLSYYFYFQDAYNAAEGDPASKVQTVKILPRGSVPQLSWQGGGGYVQDGVDPDSGEDGTEFTFQVKYLHADGTAPRTHQVWIDLNGDGAFEDVDLNGDGTPEQIEKFNMQKGSGGNYAGGVTYTFNESIKVNRVGLIAYRFSFDDSYNVAQGKPKETHYLAITNVSETCIHSGPNAQRLPDIASTSQGSLVVWEDLRDAELVDQKVPSVYKGSKIYGAFLDDQGKKADRPEIQIGNSNQSQFNPRVAAASQSNTIYLAVWEDLRNGQAVTTGSSPGYLNTDIYGQIVDADNPGKKIEVAIATHQSSDSLSPTSNQNNPAVAAGADNKFLVAWEDSISLDTTGKDIHAALVSYNPADSSAQVNEDAALNENYIIGQESDQTNPAVAWGGQNYLVVWQDYRPEQTDGEVNSHLYVNPVDTNGRVMGSEDYNTILSPKEQNQAYGFPIWTDPNFVQEHPAIASDGNNFLVVWDQKSTGPTLTGKDIYGILVKPNGMFTGLNIPICRAKGDQTNPRVSWDKINHTYLVVWTSQSFTKDVQGESSPGYDTDIRGARLDATGKLLGGTKADSAGWEVCTLQGNQESAAISGNEHINQVVWMDNRAYPYALSYEYDTDNIPHPLSYDYDIYSIPLKSFCSWGEEDGLFYGVNPGQGDNGKTYTFQINYLDFDVNSPNPKVSQVWIDLNGDGTYADTEKFTLAPGSSGSYGSNVADGKVYTKDVSLTIPDNYQGDGLISYRFYFEDANSSPVAGNANLPKTFQVILPVVSLTQESDNPVYQYSDVDPPYGVTGTTFKFRIKYTYNPLNTPLGLLGPDTAQIWIDESLDGQYQEDEKHNLNEVDSTDTDYTNGKIYSYSFIGNKVGNFLYRFYFKHPNGGVAVGAPTQDHLLYIIGQGGNSTPSITYPTWTTYNKTSGLADNQVSSLAVQDNDTLWVGTAAGLNRFDAAADPNHAWTTFTPVNAHGLAGSCITALAFDSHANVLYVGTTQGLSSYDGSTWKSYTKSSTGGLLDKNYIVALAFDTVGQALWIASSPGSQAGYGNQTSGQTSAQTSQASAQASAQMSAQAPGQTIDSLMSNLLRRYKGYNFSKNPTRFADPVLDPNNAALVQYTSEKQWAAYNTENTGGGLPSNIIIAMAVDDNGDVWVSTVAQTGTGENVQAQYKGLSRFNPDSGGWTQYTTSSNNNGGILQTNCIWKILGDDHDNLWVGGLPSSGGDADDPSAGLYRFDLQKNAWAVHFRKGNDVNMGSNAVTALSMDVDGTGIWVATLPKGNGSGNVTGGGVSLYDGTSSWTQFTSHDGLVNNYVVAIAVQAKDGTDQNGKNKKDVWFAAPTGLSRFGTGPGDSDDTSHSYFDPNKSFSFPNNKGCFVSSLGNPISQNSPFSHRASWSGWILLVISLLGTGIAPSIVRRYLWVRR